MLNDNGYTVAIAKVPLHLSILDSNKAKDIIATHSEIDEWVIIGHSLGGTSASIYAEKHPNKLAGIVFLGSYPYKDLSNMDIKTLTIVGTNDTVLNREKAEKNAHFYPKESKFISLEGGNHAQFGSYGEQKGDKIATITAQEQTEQTANYILEYFVN